MMPVVVMIVLMLALAEVLVVLARFRIQWMMLIVVWPRWCSAWHLEARRRKVSSTREAALRSPEGCRRGTTATLLVWQLAIGRGVMHVAAK